MSKEDKIFTVRYMDSGAQLNDEAFQLTSNREKVVLASLSKLVLHRLQDENSKGALAL